MSIIDAIKTPYARFPNAVGTQDLLKALAFWTMFIDHLGMCFFPEDPIMRAIGRSSAPIWFFFVGYNFKYRATLLDGLLVCAILFSIIKYILIDQIMPLHILFSLIICRIVIGYYAKYMVHASILSSSTWFIMIMAALGLLLPTQHIFEYGTLGILVAIWGYNCRHQIGDKLFKTLIIGLIQSVDVFEFTIHHLIRLISVSLTVYLLYKFKPMTLNIHGISKYFINISARYSMYLYCIHLSLFFWLSKA